MITPLTIRKSSLNLLICLSLWCYLPFAEAFPGTSDFSSLSLIKGAIKASARAMYEYTDLIERLTADVKNDLSQKKEMDETTIDATNAFLTNYMRFVGACPKKEGTTNPQLTQARQKKCRIKPPLGSPCPPEYQIKDAAPEELACLSTKDFVDALARTPASDFAESEASFYVNDPANQYRTSNNSFNAAHFFNHTFDASEEAMKPANDFILFSNILSRPMALVQDPKYLPYFQQSSKEAELDDDGIKADLHHYRLMRREYFSLVSAPVTYFYRLKQERTLVKNLAASLGIPNPNDSAIFSHYPDASPLEISRYMATRHRHPEWVKTIEQASPATVQRQILYTLSEMKYQLFQNYMNEQYVGMLMALQLSQAAQNARSNIESERDSITDKIDKALSDAAEKKSQDAQNKQEASEKNTQEMSAD